MRSGGSGLVLTNESLGLIPSDQSQVKELTNRSPLNMRFRHVGL